MSNWADLVSLQSSLQWKSKCTLQHKVLDVRCQGWCPWHPLWCWLLQSLHSLPVKLSMQAILPPQTYTHPEQLWISPWTHGLKILLPDIATHKAKDWLQNTLQLFQISPQIPCEKMQHTLTIKQQEQQKKLWNIVADFFPLHFIPDVPLWGPRVYLRFGFSGEGKRNKDSHFDEISLQVAKLWSTDRKP